jgi:high-affinity Fe2+/Pb2+ permease
MKKKLLIAAIVILMITIFFIGGAPMETVYKNFIQFNSFALIAACVYMLMREPKKKE